MRFMVVGQKYRLIGRLFLDICQKINDLFIKIEVRDFIPFASRHNVGASVDELDPNYHLGHNGTASLTQNIKPK